MTAMLNRAERFQILKNIQKYYIIGCFPVSVDLSTWKLLPASQTGKSRWPALVSFGCFFLHCLYKTITFLYAFFLKKNTPLYELALHGIFALGGSIVSFWYYLIIMKHCDVFGAYLQMTLTGNIGGNVLEDTRKTKLTKRFKEYTLRDCIAISLPYTISALIPAYGVACMYYPKLNLILYAGLPEGFQTWLTFAVLLLEEIRYLVMYSVVAVPMWMLQLISFDIRVI